MGKKGYAELWGRREGGKQGVLWGMWKWRMNAFARRSVLIQAKGNSDMAYCDS